MPHPITVIYIAGAGHSGSTLLDLLLGSVPGVLSMGEVNTIWSRAAARRDHCSCGELLDDCTLWGAVNSAVAAADPAFEPVRARRDQHRLTRLRNVAGLHVSPLLPASGRGLLRDFVRRRTAFYAAAASESGCDILVDSSKARGMASSCGNSRASVCATSTWCATLARSPSPPTAGHQARCSRQLPRPLPAGRHGTGS